jgi:hypothetical protein
METSVTEPPPPEEIASFDVKFLSANMGRDAFRTFVKKERNVGTLSAPPAFLEELRAPSVVDDEFSFRAWLHRAVDAHVQTLVATTDPPAVGDPTMAIWTLAKAEWSTWRVDIDIRCQQKTALSSTPVVRRNKKKRGRCKLT